MKGHPTILIAEDDAGHFELIKRNLWLSCVDSDIIHFKDGQEILDFLYSKERNSKHGHGTNYVLLLDIRMPKLDGREVLQRIKSDQKLKKIPVIMLTTADEVTEIEHCYEMGCSFYMVKPIDYNKFMEAVDHLGKFLSLTGVRIPSVNGISDS